MKSAIIARHKRYSQRVQNLLEQLSSYNEEALNRKPADGGWSAIQTMHHLLLSEEFSMQYLRKKMGFTTEFEAINWSSRMRSFLLWASLASPIKFKAPQAIGPENLPNYATLAETSERWATANRTWETFFNEMPDELAGKLVYKHPRAGKLSWMQTLAFFESHFRRHKKQIFRALA